MTQSTDRFQVIFEHLDRVFATTDPEAQDISIAYTLADQELDEINKLRQITEQLAQPPMVFFTRA